MTKRNSESKQWTILLFGLKFFNTCLSAEGEGVWDNASNIHTCAKGVRHRVGSSGWEGKWVGTREGAVPAFESVLSSLGILGREEWIGGKPRTHARCQKLCDAKTSKNCPVPVVGLLSRVFIERKGKIKGKPAVHTWLSSVLSMKNGLLSVWRAKVKKWRHSWAGKLPQWKTLSKHYLTRHLSFPSCSVSLACSVLNSAQSSHGLFQSLGLDVPTAQELSSQNKIPYF